MKNKSKKINTKQEGLINTIHVFSKNDQVFIKNNPDFSSKEQADEEIMWSPINFHWEPVMALKKELKINK